MSSIELVFSLLGSVLGAVSIFLLFLFEWYRRPSVRFICSKDEPTAENKRTGLMWYHITVRNQEPSWVFPRDAALNCVARVDFLDMETGERIAPQVTAHWTSQLEPRTSGTFDYTKVPQCQRIDIGFREEKFDVAIKREGEACFYAADPWVVYDDPTQWSRTRIEDKVCALRVEIEGINSGRRYTARYRLENTGLSISDLSLTLIDPA